MHRASESVRSVVAAVCLFGISTAASAQIIKNGGFEADTFADGTLNAVSPSFWSGGAAVMNPDAAGHFTGNPFLWPQAAEGQQYEDIGNEAKFALSQTFVIANAGRYDLRWQDHTGLSIPPGFQTAPYRVTLDDASAQVFSQDLDSYHSDGLWGARKVTSFLAAGSYTLTFTSLNLFNHTDTLIDAVSVDLSPAAPVPEPSTLALLIPGLAMAVAVARRRARPRG